MSELWAFLCGCMAGGAVMLVIMSAKTTKRVQPPPDGGSAGRTNGEAKKHRTMWG